MKNSSIIFSTLSTSLYVLDGKSSADVMKFSVSRSEITNKNSSKNPAGGCLINIANFDGRANKNKKALGRAADG